MKDTSLMGTLSTVPTTYVELCTNLLFNTGQPAGSQWCPVFRGSTVHMYVCRLCKSSHLVVCKVRT